MCGYKEQVGGIKVNTIMNNYVNDKGNVVCLNSSETHIEQKDKDGNVTGKLVRQDVHAQDAATSKSVEAVPIIKNRLVELTGDGAVPKSNPFASVKPPTPQEGPI